MSEGSEAIPYSAWDGSWADDDPDANFKADVAAYSQQDPLRTLETMARNLDVPVGALVRYVLARWASGGAEGLLELGPSTVERMRAAVEAAESDGGTAARLAAYDQLKAMVGWLAAGLDDPQAAYPSGGAGAPRKVRVGVYGLARDTGRVLLVRASEHDRSPGGWSLPGGGLHFGEEIEQALRREFHEETGLHVEVEELLGVGSQRDAPQPERGMPEDVQTIQIVYRVAVPTDVAPRVIEVAGSVDRTAWIGPDELRGLELIGPARWALAAT